VQAQQSPQHDPPGPQANTWRPVYGAEVAAHDRFDDQAYAHSPQLWLSAHRAAVGAGLVAVSVALLRRATR
jgi:hypothetical protein